MDLLYDSFISAILLTISFDPELFEIVGLSLKVSISSTFIATIIGLPAGFFIAIANFRAKPLIITILNTLLALPTVVIGLFVYALIARNGIWGSLDLLYTQTAIVIGQTILIIPVTTTYTIAAISKIDKRYRNTAMTLGATPSQAAYVILREARFGIVAAIIAAFGRVIAEVGIGMMLGGNAKGFTRTITTAMALEYDKGEFSLAVALGLILLSLSFMINLIFHFFQGRTS
jgi:tungstate transport system permease protein